MRLLGLHIRARTLELLRLPSYVVPTLVFPAMLYVFFGMPNADDRLSANAIMAGYCVFAVLGITFFQFGVGLAVERQSPWAGYLRILPLSSVVLFAARILSAFVFALGAVGVVIVLALAFTPIGLPAGAWWRFVIALLAGGVPFGLFGIAIGYWASPRGALPLANLLYLPLSYAGGLWGGPRQLPDVVAAISPYLPSRRYFEIVWSVALDRSWQLDDWLWLLGYTVGFGLLGLWRYRRDEGERYQ